MSNKQTVREALAIEISSGDDPYDSEIEWAGDCANALGIDPDMSVTELQRRLRIAERVLTVDVDAIQPSDDLFGPISAYDLGARDLLDHLTPEDDR